MRIYVIGTGGVGGYFGGRLAANGEDVVFFDRGKHYESMKENGLTVKSVKGDFHLDDIKVIQSLEQVHAPDIVLITTKTYSNEEIMSKLALKIGAGTAIVTLQNGIVNDLAILKYLQKRQDVFPGAAFIISKKNAPGEIVHEGGLGRVLFGARDGSRPEKLVYLEKAFKDAGVDAILSEDIERDIWKKYIFISAFSGITAVTRSSIGAIVHNKRMLNLYERCVQEAIELARLVNVKVPDTIFEDVMQLTVNTIATAKSSLLHDIEAKRRTEIETLNGTLVHLAQNNNLDVPINEMIYSIVKLWDDQFKEGIA